MLKTGLRLIGVYAIVESLSLIGLNANSLFEWNGETQTLVLAKNAAEAAAYLVGAIFVLGVIPAFALAIYAQPIARWLQRGATERTTPPASDRLFQDGLMLLALYFFVSGTARSVAGGLQVAADLLREDLPRWFPYSLPQLLDGIVRVGGGSLLYSLSRGGKCAAAPHNKPLQTDEP